LIGSGLLHGSGERGRAFENLFDLPSQAVGLVEAAVRLDEATSARKIAKKDKLDLQAVVERIGK
jgi:hypothetical protein